MARGYQPLFVGRRFTFPTYEILGSPSYQVEMRIGEVHPSLDIPREIELVSASFDLDLRPSVLPRPYNVEPTLALGKELNRDSLTAKDLL